MGGKEKIDLSERRRIAEPCAYPGDIHGEHDHDACLDASRDYRDCLREKILGRSIGRGELSALFERGKRAARNGNELQACEEAADALLYALGPKAAADYLDRRAREVDGIQCFQD